MLKISKLLSSQGEPMADISMSDSELLALPVSVPLAVAARAFGLGRNKASELARVGEFPCPVIRVGERYRVNRAALFEALSFDPAAVAASPRPAA
jgi:hypothetical protein